VPALGVNMAETRENSTNWTGVRLILPVSLT
jgi:hypothetical protein